MSRNNEISSKLNDNQESLFSSDMSKWNNDKVCEWLKEKKFLSYIDDFKSSKINGYDLCFLTNNDLQNELKISSFHDRNSILKSIRESLLRQCIFYYI